MSNTDKPLDGVLVVTLEQAVAAPFASSRLADAGARVIKVERPETGDFARHYDYMVHGESAHFVWLNRGKESVALDIKTDDDKRLLKAMIARADVFIQNLAPGAAARLGLESDGLRAHHPKLITCDISGYGEDGPYRDAKAYDLLIQCESGLTSITGTPEGPGRVGVSVCDIATGMAAHAGITEALFAQARTGVGRGISISMFDVMADWMNVPLLCHDYAGRTMPRNGLNHPTICPYGAFTCADGTQIVISIQNEREWLRFCETVLADRVLASDPRYCSNTRRLENRPELEAVIACIFAAQTSPDMTDILRDAGIAFGAVNEVKDLSVHPQLTRIEIDTPTGPVSYGGPPIRRSDEGGIKLGPVPKLGEHTEAIRKEFADKK